MRRNPDVDLRSLERQYRESGSLADATRLMNAYLRAGNHESAATLLQIVEDLYHAGGYKDLGLEAVIVATHLGLGKKSADLCGGGFGTVVCRYDKTIIWDVKRNYPLGTTQGWIDAINSYLIKWGWVDSTPTLFKDILHPSQHETFERQQAPSYAIALFHETSIQQEAWGEPPRDDAWIRVLWRNVYLPQIEADYSENRGFRGRSVHNRTDIMLEDEPICSDYAGPKICTGYLKVCGSGGRSSFSESFTLRVPLRIGISKSLKTMEMLANRIYFAEKWEDATEASGTNLYWPTQEDVASFGD